MRLWAPALIALALCLLALPALALDSEENAFLYLINDYRLANDLSLLALSPTLTKSAELHSQDMASQDYFSHYSLDGRSPFDRMRDAGYNYPTSLGENIAAGYITAAQVFQAWKNSPGHDANMLYPGFRAIGIGRAYNASSYYKWYWTTDFGGYDDSGMPLPPTVQVTSPTHPNQEIWYANNDPIFAWEEVPDAEGYSFHLDHSASTTPDTSIDSSIPSAAYFDLQDGIWYFHMRVKTAAGWGQASHYVCRIDCTPPSPPAIASDTHPDQQFEYPDEDPTFTWSIPVDTSGIRGYSYVLDHNPLTIPEETVSSASNQKRYAGIGEGTWYFHVRAVDNAGNWGQTSHFKVIVRFYPVADFQGYPRTGYEPLLVTFTDLSSSRTGVTRWLWDFGDGSTSQERNPSHLYTRQGSFDVFLTVWEADGDSNTLSRGGYVTTLTPTPDTSVIESVSGPWDPIVGAAILGIYPLADSYVSPSQPLTNYGQETFLVVDCYGSCVYIAFDLSEIPKQAHILDAGLSLYYESGNGLTRPEVRISYAQDCSWGETDISWSNAPAETYVECGTKVVPSMFGTYVRFDVPDAVRNGLSKAHVTLKVSIASGNGTLVFASRESQHVQARPLLVVRYAIANVYRILLGSVEDSGLIPNLGLITIDGVACRLPSNVSIVAGSYTLSYLPGYIFGFWDFQGQLSVANASQNATILTVWGQGTLLANGDSKAVTYGYDDGTCDLSVGASPGKMLAVKFSPILVGDVSKIWIFFDDVSENEPSDALLHILSRDGTELAPPTIVRAHQGWQTVEVDGPRGVASDFLVALEYLADGLPKIGVDVSSCGSSFIRQNSSWVSLGSNLMIRCELQHTGSPKLSSRLSIWFGPENPRAGELLAIFGRLEPELPSVAITITLSPPGRPGVNLTILTDDSGQFLFEYLPTRAGLWHILAHWAGTSNCSAAVNDAYISVEKGYVYITCSVEPLASHFGQTIKVIGHIRPGGLEVTIEYEQDAGPWAPLAQVNSSLDGRFELNLTPPRSGNYEFRAAWPGDQNFREYVSQAARHLVLKAQSSITCTLNPTSTVCGSSVEIFGQISPPAAGLVTILCYGDGEHHELALVASGEDGSFEYKWTVNLVGALLISSSWQGNENLNGASSDWVILQVESIAGARGPIDDARFLTVLLLLLFLFRVNRLARATDGRTAFPQ